MSDSPPLGDLATKIVALHEMLASMHVAHQFGGAIALAWYRSPRATTDIDINITVPPGAAGPVLSALEYLGVTITEAERVVIDRDGQARLDWSGTYLDVFFATFELHYAMERWARRVRFGPAEIPILASEHLIVCKAIFDRAKDWVDIEAVISWGTAVDRLEVLRWISEILGPTSVPYRKLDELLAVEDGGCSA